MARCFFKPFAPDGIRDCDGNPRGHHVVKRQTIRNAIPVPRFASDEELRAAKRRRRLAIEDRRNIITCCNRHHELWHNGRIAVPREALPASLEAFLEEYELAWALDRPFGVGEAR